MIPVVTACDWFHALPLFDIGGRVHMPNCLLTEWERRLCVHHGTELMLEGTLVKVHVYHYSRRNSVNNIQIFG